ncbi:MAG: bifunctional 3,4-dihydroxy-2-butanone-4-phosphate synthase/GTP cyclohydrolase II [Planctomycetota bacterium]|nr:MAG: bifunctional 3,4-dihydroxy-2-butanone-4-phosphate synthase/GTP cyclohydrolase II [Planctomycetota bacterium]
MLDSVEEAIEAFVKGEIVVIVDDEDRENEGDLCVAAEKVTPEIINSMATLGRGLICLAMENSLADKLELPPMVTRNTSSFSTNFTISIDVNNGSTGISAQDRAETILTCVKEDVKPDDLVRPGHIFPLRAQDGGVLIRAGQTEASVDLAKLAGLKGAGVICEIMSEDGSMMRGKELIEFSKKHNYKIISVESIQKYRIKNDEVQVANTVSSKLPTEYGEFDLHYFKNAYDDKDHLILSCGDLKPGGPIQEEAILVRVHSECFTGDVLHSTRCDCGEQLHKAQKMLADEGKGIIVYLRQEGRGIGLENKLKAYNFQDDGLDTLEANKKLGLEPDLRTYGLGAQMIYQMGVRKIKLLTNNPSKITGIRGYGLEIVERIAIETNPKDDNIEYLKTKKTRFGHLLKHKKLD